MTQEIFIRNSKWKIASIKFIPGIYQCSPIHVYAWRWYHIWLLHSGLGGDNLYLGDEIEDGFEPSDPEFEDFFDPAFYGNFQNPYQLAQQTIAGKKFLIVIFAYLFRKLYVWQEWTYLFYMELVFLPISFKTSLKTWNGLVLVAQYYLQIVMWLNFFI